jgi:hypothetical protein
MIINGRKPSGPNAIEIVIPRGDGDHFRFKAQAVLDFEPFLKLCPPPTPPKMQRKGTGWFENVEDPKYKAALLLHSELEMDWLYLQSLTATEGLQWETVKADDYTTWKNWRQEMQDAGFSRTEVGRIVKAIWRANCLDESYIEEARKSFSQPAG